MDKICGDHYGTKPSLSNERGYTSGHTVDSSAETFQTNPAWSLPDQVLHVTAKKNQSRKIIK